MQSVGLPVAIVAWLDAEAKANDMSRSALATAILMRARGEDAALYRDVAERHERAMRRAEQLFGLLCGIVRESPDVSENQKRLALDALARFVDAIDGKEGA